MGRARVCTQRKHTQLRENLGELHSTNNARTATTEIQFQFNFMYAKAHPHRLLSVVVARPVGAPAIAVVGVAVGRVPYGPVKVARTLSVILSHTVLDVAHAAG